RHTPSSSAAITTRRCNLGARGHPSARGDFVGAHCLLTTAGSMVGQVGVAAAALQELRRAPPNISIAWITNQMLSMQGGELDYLDALRRRAWTSLASNSNLVHFRDRSTRRVSIWVKASAPPSKPTNPCGRIIVSWVQQRIRRSRRQARPLACLSEWGLSPDYQSELPCQFLALIGFFHNVQIIG